MTKGGDILGNLENLPRERVYTEQERAKILQADIMCCRHLGNANEAAERGQHARAERLYAKSQYWLDRWNKLTGNGE